MNFNQKACKVSVLGAGSWGIALSMVLESNGHEVTLWEFRPDAAERLSKTRDAKEFLPGISIPAEIRIENNLGRAVFNKDFFVFAVPSHVLRHVATLVNKLNCGRKPLVVNVAKGIENDTLLRMSQVLEQTIDWLALKNIVTLSGPSHAEEVSRKIPTAIVAACKIGRAHV